MVQELSILPEIPEKRYFTIGEVSKLCLVKPHVLRYWEQEFSHINPSKRMGRRYYQVDDILIIRTIRHLLYIDGFTISGAKQHLKKGKKTNGFSTELQRDDTFSENVSSNGNYHIILEAIGALEDLLREV